MQEPVQQERRKRGRSPALARFHGRLRSTMEASILDLSADGLCLELPASLRPNGIYDLQADLPGHRITARIRVTRCRAGGFREDGNGGRSLLFQAGAEFLWTGAEPRRALETFLARDMDPSSDSGILRIPG